MEFLDLLRSYPVFIYTILLGVVLVYWLLAMFGMLDFEHGGPDMDMDLDVDVDIDVDVGGDVGAGANAHAHAEVDGSAPPHSVSTLASWLLAFGLGGVPFSIVVSLLALFSWVICGVVTAWVLPIVPTSLLKFVVGTALLVGAFALAIPVTSLCVRPMRRLFVAHAPSSHASLLGHSCVIRSEFVNEHSGYARVVTENGGEYDIKVVSPLPNNLKNGVTAVIVDYDSDTEIFHVSEKELF